MSEHIRKQKTPVGKSSFTNVLLRRLVRRERVLLKNIEDVLKGKSRVESIAVVPGFVSVDGRPRPLLFSHEIAHKIIRDHGTFLPENLLINANDWRYVIRNVKGDRDKINLIYPTVGEGFLRIGANRDNGFYIVTHYENIAGKSQKLKNLLEKGDFLDRNGRAQMPSFATSPEGAASQPVGAMLSGVKPETSNIANSKEGGKSAKTLEK